LTYLTERATSGRRPLTLVEIDVDTCANDYGVLPCEAVLPAAGLQCYNTFSSCQDKSNYAKTVKTLRFCEDIAGLPVDFNAIPSIPVGGVKLDATIIDPAKTLGIRAKTTVTFKDHPYGDSVTDPYVITRTYDPLENGTFWGKFIARNPNYEGRQLRVTIGYLDDNNVFNTQFNRVFVIDKINGPDSNGKVNIVAKDILKLAENKNSKLPVASAGKLTSVLAAGATSLSVTAGEGDSYAAAGVIRVNKELMNYTRAGDIFTVTRGEFGTLDVEQSVNASVQECIAYNDVNVIEIVRDLLLRIDIDPVYIPFTDWEQERDDWLLLNEYTRVISKPTGVSQLLNELCEQSLISIWWDERVKQIKLKSMSPPLDISTIPTINQSDNFIINSLKLERLTQDRITQIWLYNELIDQVADNKKQESYQQVNVSIDLDAESSDFFNDKRERIVFGTWLTNVSNALKIDIAQKTINKFKLSPIKAKFSLDAKDADIWTGDIVFIETDTIQTVSGQPSTLIMLVTKAQETIAGTLINYEASTAFDYAVNYGFWSEDDVPDYLIATAAERLKNAFYSDNNGLLPDGSPGYTYI